jgi:hypothetical protein
LCPLQPVFRRQNEGSFERILCLYSFAPQGAQLYWLRQHGQFIVGRQRDCVSLSLCDCEIRKITQYLLISPMMIYFTEDEKMR